MIRVTAAFVAKPGQEDELIAAMSHAASLTRREEGCVEYELHRSTDNPQSFVMIEKWKSQQDLESHLQMSYIQELFQAAERILAGPPTISTWTRVNI